MFHQASLYIASGLHDANLPDVQRIPGTDVTHIVTDRLSIAVVRDVIEGAYRAPLELSEKHFVIVAKTMTREAQNALLKVLEEPPQTTCFALVLPSTSQLLPTVLSRVQLIQETAYQTAGDSSFLYMSYNDRLEFIQKVARDKNHTAIHAILSECYQYLQQDNSGTSSPELYRVLQLAVLRINEPGASPKMLCERVALAFPIVVKD